MQYRLRDCPNRGKDIGSASKCRSMSGNGYSLTHPPLPILRLIMSGPGRQSDSNTVHWQHRRCRPRRIAAARKQWTRISGFAPTVMRFIQCLRPESSPSPSQAQNETETETVGVKIQVKNCIATVSSRDTGFTPDRKQRPRLL